jgi:hypothetical protein
MEVKGSLPFSFASPNLSQINPVLTHDPFEASSNITSGAGIATVVVDILQGFGRET